MSEKPTRTRKATKQVATALDNGFVCKMSEMARKHVNGLIAELSTIKAENERLKALSVNGDCSKLAAELERTKIALDVMVERLAEKTK